VRYAIYYMPDPQGPLWRFGSSVLGYDAASRAEVAFPKHAAFEREQIAAWTAEPRRYGFHATLKPPFALADGVSRDELMQTASAFVREHADVRIGRLEIAAIGPFLALVPASPVADLDTFAGNCVRAFDRFRAPLTSAERARRLQVGLTPRQIRHLDAWGYPYVFEDFRFHMTLSGPLHETDREQFAAALSELYAPVSQGLGAVEIDAIAVFSQSSLGNRFVLEQRFAFAG